MVASELTPAVLEKAPLAPSYAALHSEFAWQIGCGGSLPRPPAGGQPGRSDQGQS